MNNENPRLCKQETKHPKPNLKNVLIKYIRDYSGRCEEKVACIVATSPNNIGLAICPKAYKFDRYYMLRLAAGNAALNTETIIPNRMIMDADGFEYSLEEAINAELQEMKIRAAKYYK
jgi:hypothetical protein